MKCWLLPVLLLCITSLAPPAAQAFVEDPYIVPAHPTPETPIWVHVRMGWCHASLDAVDGAELQVIAPGQLRLITNGIVLDPGHPFCNGPPFTYRFDVGTLPTGSYTLQIFIRDDIGGAGLVGFGSVNFSVRSPMKIPATSIALLVALLLGVCVIGALATRRSSRWAICALLSCVALIALAPLICCGVFPAR